ncbi:uncharacterized protein METZ01_LOCUS99142 [marine metagenome]|uniref:CENP-V/GFA domain-containing protein n=1 Tax=marine metagenome TaxID=408172 RepID=A0A381W2U8_9ZZZZ
MSDKYESGGCLCGAIKYEFDKSNLISAHHCHCIDCQKSTGSGKSTILMLPAQAILMDGELKFYTSTTSSGRNMSRGFCEECGSPVLSFIKEMQEVNFLKAGSLDDSSWLKIDSNFYSSSAHSWSPIDEDILSFTHNPDQV